MPRSHRPRLDSLAMAVLGTTQPVVAHPEHLEGDRQQRGGDQAQQTPPPGTDRGQGEPQQQDAGDQREVRPHQRAQAEEHVEPHRPARAPLSGLHPADQRPERRPEPGERHARLQARRREVPGGRQREEDDGAEGHRQACGGAGEQAPRAEHGEQDAGRRPGHPEDDRAPGHGVAGHHRLGEGQHGEPGRAGGHLGALAGREDRAVAREQVLDDAGS